MLSGRFVHTRNISGLTDKCAQRMSQVLISGGDGDAGPVPGIPSAEGNAAGRAYESMGRNPNANIFVPFILGLALIESLVIYCLVVAFQLMGKF